MFLSANERGYCLVRYTVKLSGEKVFPVYPQEWWTRRLFLRKGIFHCKVFRSLSGTHEYSFYDKIEG